MREKQGMISFHSVSVRYGQNSVIENFSASFETCGFYLLLGESGSGKTSFLNVLAGFLPFEGSIRWGEKVFTGQVRHTEPLPFDYITQDSVFIDYLTVGENLRLFGREEQIDSYLKAMDLLEKKELFPPVLSGGERQRLAIIRALLRGKRILLLDEPTAALDSRNKRIIFERLAAIKNEALILCASHDPEAVNYADAVLSFSKAGKTPGFKILRERQVPESSFPEAWNDEPEKPPLLPFLKKWFSSGQREQKVRKHFAFFLGLSCLLFFLADTPSHKLAATCANLYQINVLQLELRKGIELADLNLDLDQISEVAVNYRGTCPSFVETEEGEKRYSPFIWVLPEKETNCRVADRLLCGTYFTAENQVILSYEMAESMMPGHPERLVGKSIIREIYGLGNVDLQIAGVFDQLNKTDKIYLNACGAEYDPEQADKDLESMIFFVNAALLRPLIPEEGFFRGEGQRAYLLYFDTCAACEQFLQENAFRLLKQDCYLTRDSVHTIEEFELPYLSWILIPFATMAAVFTALFFVELNRTEFVYNNSFVSVFEYAGYSKKSIFRGLTVWGLLDFLKLFAAVSLAAVLISFVGNALNHRLLLTDFELFSYNPGLLAVFCGGILLLVSWRLQARFKSVKRLSWYENLISNRDVL